MSFLKPGKPWLTPQVSKIMRVLFFLLTVAFLQVSASGTAQKITVTGKKIPIASVFSSIEKQTGLVFFYNNNDLAKAKPVTLELRNVPIDDGLKEIFKEQPLTYVIRANTIFITGKTNVETPVRQDIQITTAPPPVVVKGKIINEDGTPLSGATVQIKGKTGGTTSKSNGEFEFTSNDDNPTIVISYVGYITQEIKYSSQQYLMVKLQPNANSLNSVVVVGYGTQKKQNITGAVDQIGTEFFEDRPMPSITKGLQGALPNLNIKMTDGKPTRSATYNIRGATSIGAGATPGALVLIDGVSGDPDNVNPADIESVTVLKDAASASIYGARAAFGVVLITTKTPKTGKTQINYTANFSNNRRTTTPDLVTDGYTWAKSYADALFAWNDYGTFPVNIDGKLLFSQAYLDSLKLRSENPALPNWGLDASGNYAYYGSTDWMKELYKNSNNSMEHVLSVSSATDKMKILMSGRWFTQDGIFRYNPDKFNRYNLRVKGEIKLSDKFFINANVEYATIDYKYPLTSQGGVHSIWRLLAASGYPIAPLLNPDGTLTNIASFSVGDLYQQQSFSQLRKSTSRNILGFTALPFKHLTVKGDFTYINTNSTDERRYFPVTYSVRPGSTITNGLSYLENYDEREKNFIGNIYAEYQKNFGSHNVKVLLGGNTETYAYRPRRIRRDGLIVNNIVDFNLATGTNYVLTGGGNEWATAGLFSRINYDFKGRYLVSLNGRYDGSSRFPTNKAWAFFPSAEAGWIISRERFLDNTPWINLLKVRASYGALGNGNITPYSFLPTIGVSTSPVLQGSIFPNYIQRPNVLPNNITWERVKMLNLGLDFTTFKNRLTTTFDIYERNTIGMITVGPPLPAVFGAGVPNGNNADMRTRGWELSLNWQDKIQSRGQMSYGVRVTLADNVSTITKFYNPNKLLSTYYEGYRLGDIWGFQTLGFFADAADVTNSPNQRNYFQVSNGNNILPGDLKFADLNGDKFINIGTNTLANPGDRKIIGNSLPRLTYGVNAFFTWNDLSFSAFVQGVGKRDWMPSVEAAYFWGQYNRPYSVLPTFNLNRWTPENPDPNAYFPRNRGFVALSGTRELAVAQSRYLQDASYVRLKNVTISYNLPKKFIQKIGAASVRIYVTGQNLWTYSPMFRITRNFDPEVIEGSDPEVNGAGGDGFSYPMEKTFSFGINIGF